MCCYAADSRGAEVEDHMWIKIVSIKFRTRLCVL